MANPLLGQILGSVFSNVLAGRTTAGTLGNAGVLGNGGLSDMLGGLLGRGHPVTQTSGPGRSTQGGGLGGVLAGNKGMLLTMLLPMAMQWVQRNGGIGAVLDRFRQKGYGQHANSWLSTGTNQMLETSAIDNVVGSDELSRLSRQLGVPQQDVSQGFAEIIPEVANQLSPDGQLPPQANEALDSGLSTLEKELNEMQTGITA